MRVAEGVKPREGGHHLLLSSSPQCVEGPGGDGRGLLSVVLPASLPHQPHRREKRASIAPLAPAAPPSKARLHIENIGSPETRLSVHQTIADPAETERCIQPTWLARRKELIPRSPFAFLPSVVTINSTGTLPGSAFCNQTSLEPVVWTRTGGDN